MIGGGLGTLLLVVVMMLLGVDPQQLLNQLPQQPAPGQQQGPVETSPEEEKLKEFVATTLASTEDVWNGIFDQMGQQYREPKLVLFTGQVQSACGFAQAAMGPFYCPADSKVYIDLSFYQDLKADLGSPGDFAQAYVIAHEIGHHVQNLLGISDKVAAQRGRVSEVEYNKLSVRLELQADCLAGVWASHADRMRQVVEPGDIDEALNAASNIGDDRLQSRSQGRVVPDSFTHGSSAQRVSWFRRGFEAGEIGNCDTFGAKTL